jgi:hypothetical protein
MSMVSQLYIVTASVWNPCQLKYSKSNLTFYNVHSFARTVYANCSRVHTLTMYELSMSIKMINTTM